MSGHSKWSTIKRKKGANDAKRGQLFAKLVKAIEIAARNGGTDPANNASLYQAIQKAKSNSVPNENIERALKRVDGNLETGEIFELSYEGYAPHGVALLISCLTDNKNRTSSDVKATLTKHGGSMGTPGSVNYLFERKAVFQFDKYNDELIDLALNSDCLDILESNQSVTFEFPPSDFKNMNEQGSENETYSEKFYESEITKNIQLVEAFKGQLYSFVGDDSEDKSVTSVTKNNDKSFDRYKVW